MDKRRNGFAIALAWPETFCKQPVAWYNWIMNLLKITTDNHYQVGHSAVVLVNEVGECHYFDFGRYHAPFGFGRVRSEFTDSELKLQSKAEIKDETILNFSAILEELSQKKECHGDGKMWSSYTPINFEKAKEKAEIMRLQSPIEYGPFVRTGTNCSRFTRKVILSGNPKLLVFFKLFFRYTITASPAINVKALRKPTILKTSRDAEKPLKKKLLNDVLLAPKNKPHLQAKWFAGEGAGSWFTFQIREKNIYVIEKYCPDLDLESQSEMSLEGDIFLNVKADFRLIFPCNSREINLLQNGNHLVFRKVEEFNSNYLHHSHYETS